MITIFAPIAKGSSFYKYRLIYMYRELISRTKWQHLAGKYPLISGYKFAQIKGADSI